MTRRIPIGPRPMTRARALALVVALGAVAGVTVPTLAQLDAQEPAISSDASQLAFAGKAGREMIERQEAERVIERGRKMLEKAEKIIAEGEAQKREAERLIALGRERLERTGREAPGVGI